MPADDVICKIQDFLIKTHFSTILFKQDCMKPVLMLLFFYTINLLVYVFIFSNIMLIFKSIHACAGLKMDQRLTCTHTAC